MAVWSAPGTDGRTRHVQAPLWELHRGESGCRRENHKMMLDHCQQTKNLLVSYSENA